MKKRRLIESKSTEGLKNATHIDVEVYYSLGGMNYFSGMTMPRGYYVRVTPVTRDGVTVSFVMFSGVSEFLMEANRYTAKQFEKAVEMSKAVIPGLIQKVIEKERAA